ncbi:MAG: cell division protein SepF [Coriobacteriales bacterium]|jgi:cell division inhibitor SepF|nr:cell division protein SepF [Coriobacteriales bacterium]
MGIWDSVKSRLGKGDRNDRHGRYRHEDVEYAEGAYETYDNESAYDDYNYGNANDYDDQPAPMRSFGVDRADYYNDNHAPLVTQADVRSLPVMNGGGQVADRIPAPRAYRRGTDRSKFQTPALDEDALAFKGGLARTAGSFAHLQTERIRMENSGRLPRVEDSAAQQAGTIVDARAYNPAASTLATTGQVRQRVHRRIEHIRPATYADAEQVATELRKGVIVVVDLRTTRPELAKRILDFSFGVASALEGQVDRHIDRVYVFTRSEPLTEEERAAIQV